MQLHLAAEAVAPPRPDAAPTPANICNDSIVRPKATSNWVLVLCVIIISDICGLTLRLSLGCAVTATRMLPGMAQLEDLASVPLTSVSAICDCVSASVAVSVAASVGVGGRAVFAPCVCRVMVTCK